MKKFCKSLREHEKKIIDFDKKKMLPLVKKSSNHIKMKWNVTLVERRGS